MAKDPAVLFYTSDFLSGVMDLDMFERGQYITILCAQHQKGHLSEKTICLLVGSVSVSVLSKFQKDEQGNFFNERMEFEAKKRAEYSDSRRENGKLGGRPKKQKTKPYPKHMQNHMDNHMENENENENDNINNIEKREKKFISDIAIFVQDYGKDMCREFFDYWSERNSDKGKMRFEMEKTWDLSKRLSRWSLNNKNNTYGKSSSNTKIAGFDYARQLNEVSKLSKDPPEPIQNP